MNKYKFLSYRAISIVLVAVLTIGTIIPARAAGKSMRPAEWHQIQRRCGTMIKRLKH